MVLHVEEFDRSGTWLASAAKNRIMFYQLNSDGTILPAGATVTTSGNIEELHWDNAGHLIAIDNSVAKWGNLHASAISTEGLNVVTQLGGIYTVIALCVVLAVAESIVERSVWVTPFIIALAGCFQGMLVEGDAEQVGLKTTAAVVQSIFLVIVLDAVFAVFFSEIGWI